ncbi:ABC transporter ATP-binding protein [Mycobacterium sp. NPDC003449]
MSTNTLLEVKDLCAGYGKIRVLHEVSMKVDAGEVVALLGPNGAGKTTLLAAMSGLLDDIDSGTVLLDGKDVTGAGPRAMVKSGLLQIIEGHRVFGDLTVEENLLLGTFGFSRSDRTVALDRAYERFPELTDKRRAKAGQLSGGQQQMLVIAMGLARGPRIILLDEPSAGLAPVLVDRILHIVRDLSEEGLAVIVVEQLVEKVLTAADRAYVLAQGSITYSGRADALFGDGELKRAYLG